MIGWGREISGDLPAAERREWLCANGIGGYASGTVADALIEKRVWMEPSANTTYVRYQVLRARGPVGLQLRLLVNYRDYHATTRGDGWRMDIAPVTHGLRVIAYGGARALLLLADRGDARIAHTWYRGFDLPRERERGLDAEDDHLHAATFQASLEPRQTLTLVLSSEPAPSLDGERAWGRRARHDAEIHAAWRRAQPAAERAPAWI